ncbi:MAG TPA: ABC transporter permease [Paracoccaceae bacterium]|nr:ABC transporter permease [Paracoccaceae bacterium]
MTDAAAPRKRHRPESPFRVHLRVVTALLRREMATRYGRTSGGYFWAVAEPAGMIGMMSMAFAALSRKPDLGQSFIVFFATGFLSFNFYRMTALQLFSAVRSNRALLNYPNVAIYDAMVARLLLQTLTNCMVAVVILGIAIWYTGQTVQLDVAWIAPALGAATLLAFGVGVMNSVLFQMFPLYQRVFLIVNRPLFIISGVLYIPEILPTQLRELIAWNPLVHVVSGFRQGVYPSYHSMITQLEYPALCGLVTLALGLLLLRRFGERLMDQ